MTTLVQAKNSTIVRKNIELALLRMQFAIGSWFAPRATLQHAYDLFCTPLSSSRQRALSAPRNDARELQLAFDDERLTAYVWGDPHAQPYVLLAHGWSSFGLRFLPWVEPLRAAGYAVVSFDQVAHGLSSGRRTTLPRFAEALLEVAFHFGAPAAVVGHSLGGAAAMLALADGLAAKRAVLIAPPADPLAASRRFGRFVHLAGHLTRRLFDAYDVVNPEREVRQLRVQQAAPAIGVPSLIVHDLGDREVPWEEGERYARHWLQSRLLTTDGLGHHRIVDDVGVIRAAIDFLQGDEIGERVVSSPNLPYGFA